MNPLFNGIISPVEKNTTGNALPDHDESFCLVQLDSDCDSISLESDSPIIKKPRRKEKPQQHNQHNESDIIRKYTQSDVCKANTESTPKYNVGEPETNLFDCYNNSLDYGPVIKEVLTGVIAYVEVRSDLGDLSKLFAKHLHSLGAEISATLCKKTTHIVFKNGKPSTYKKGIEMKIPIVSVLWIDMCKKTLTKVQEDLFPATAPTVKEEDFMHWLVRMNKPWSGKKAKRKLFSDKGELLAITTNLDTPTTSKAVVPALNRKGKKKRASLALMQWNKNEIKNSLDEFVIRKVKSLKTKAHLKHIVLTNIEAELQDTLKPVIQAFGGIVLDTASSSRTTHVICGEKKRTLNILFGMVRGCWILSPKWILDSLEAGNWLLEEKYELSSYFPAVTLSREQRRIIGPSYRADLFGHLGNIFIAPNSVPPQQQLAKLIMLAGGKVSTCLRQSQLIVGNYACSKKKNIVQITEKRFLDCVSDYTMLKLENDKA